MFKKTKTVGDKTVEALLNRDIAEMHAYLEQTDQVAAFLLWRNRVRREDQKPHAIAARHAQG